MTIKDKLLEYSKFKGYSVNAFCKKLGLSGSFFARNSGITTDVLEEILHKCEDINPDWLLIGKGEMLRKTDPEDNPADNPLHIDIEAVKLLIAEKDRTIADLKSQLDKKDQQIDRLIQALSTPH